VALEPGRGLQLDSDAYDAARILSLTRALYAEGEWLGSGVLGRQMRELLWFKWEQPRLPRPLIDGKYPCAYPWSAQAREVYFQSPEKAGRTRQLVIEHVLPKRELFQRLAAEISTLTPTGMQQLLHESCLAAVITKEEDRVLDNAGMNHVRPDENDVWSRYRSAGLDLSTFAPLELPVFSS